MHFGDISMPTGVVNDIVRIPPGAVHDLFY